VEKKEAKYSCDFPELKFEICIPAQTLEGKVKQGRITSTVKRVIQQHLAQFLAKGQTALYDIAKDVQPKLLIEDKEIDFRIEGGDWFPASVNVKGLHRETILESLRTKPKRTVVKNPFYKDTKAPRAHLKKGKALFEIYKKVKTDWFMYDHRGVDLREEIQNGVLEEKAFSGNLEHNLWKKHNTEWYKIKDCTDASNRVKHYKDDVLVRLSSSVEATIQEMLAIEEEKRLNKEEEKRVSDKIW